MFMVDSPYAPYLAFVSGLVLAFGLGLLFTNERVASHPIGYADNQDEVHVHSDFIVYLDEQQLDLSAEKYMSASNHVLHAHVHLHDDNDEVIHRHDHDITLADFFNSLGFTLTNECLTTDTETQFCSNETEQLLLFVNGTPTTSIASYVNQEEDQLLLYYGNPNAPVVNELLGAVTDEACIYSGTCPERGTPPPEACGITCEL